MEKSRSKNYVRRSLTFIRHSLPQGREQGAHQQVKRERSRGHLAEKKGQTSTSYAVDQQSGPPVAKRTHRRPEGGQLSFGWRSGKTKCTPIESPFETK